MAYSGFKGIGPNKLGCGHKGAPKAPGKILGAIAGAVAPALIKGAAGALMSKAVGKKAKPDFLDLDKDGNTSEPMKSAAPAKQRNQRVIKSKIDKEMAKDAPDAKKINRLENRREVKIAKDKVKSIKTKQKIQKLQDKKSVLDNPNAAG